MPKICPQTRMPSYTELVARVEQSAMRRAADPANPGDPRHSASYRACRACKGWHVHLPPERRDVPKDCPTTGLPRYNRVEAQQQRDYLRRGADPANPHDPHHRAQCVRCDHCQGWHVISEEG